MICIYCKNTINESNASLEHIFPESFGCPRSFSIECVCQKCNNELGGTVDRILAGDCMEGLWRLQNIGSKSKKHIKQTRVKLNVPDEEKFGTFAGAIVFVDFTKIDAIYLPQQIVLKEGDKKIFYLYEDLDKPDVKEKISASKEKFAILAHNVNEFEVIVKKLRSMGNKIDGDSQPISENVLDEDGKFHVAAEFIIDDFIFRAVSKIAFNYLAKVHTYGYALESRFDSIRNYIRTGKKAENLVQIRRGHILADETSDKYFLRGHLFTLQSKNNVILSRIAITNQYDFYYEIKLGEMGFIWHDVKSGHAYSIDGNEILDLHSPTFLAAKGFVMPKYVSKI